MFYQVDKPVTQHLRMNSQIPVVLQFTGNNVRYRSNTYRNSNSRPQYCSIHQIYYAVRRLKIDNFCLITARIRRMGEGTVFSLAVHTSTGGRLPHLAEGGTPPRSRQGGTPSQVQMGGLPHLRSGQGVPHPADWGGYPHPRSGQDLVPQGTPLSRTGWGIPLSRTGWAPSPTPSGDRPP